MMSTLASLANSLAAMLWPPLCVMCGRRLTAGESSLCMHCLHALPRAILPSLEWNYIVERLTGTRTLVQRAVALFEYSRHDPYSRIIHIAKYDGCPRVAADMGRLLAAELMPRAFFAGIDLITPVPLTTAKRLRRGYNQSRVIAEAVGAVAGIPVADTLRVARTHTSQTRLSGSRRRANAAGAYAVAHAAPLQGRHVLLVDDVITTGATLGACIRAILAAAPGAQVSVLTLGATVLDSA